MDLSRRLFLGISATGALTLYSGTRRLPVAVAAVAGGTLDPGAIPKFVTPLLVPPAMPRKGTADGSRVDTYELSVRQISQQILPAGMPRTTVWAYGPVLADGSTSRHHAPSYTVETRAGRPVRITWVNGLVDRRGHFLPHLLPVDPSLHWANPQKLRDHDGRCRTDSRPALHGLTYVAPQDFSDPGSQYTCYRGPVPWVTHLHGAVDVPDDSDGYPEAWTLPPATNLPRGIAAHGTWYAYLAQRFAGRHGVRWTPGRQVAQYPNRNRASTLWFHDHTLGLTRLNVYAGPAGFYLIRGGAAGDAAIRDRRTGRRAVLPGPAPKAGDPAGTSYREIVMAIQDRSFQTDGSLFYPDTRRFFDDTGAPYYPANDVSPVWNPEFFGNTLMVNGATWPYLDVERRRYRFRLLNGCNSRTLDLDFSRIPGVKVWQIGNDGGLLPAVVDVVRGRGGKLLLGPAERADLIVDFAAVPLGRHVLANVAPDGPFNGRPDADPADPATTGQVMQFRVRRARTADGTTPGDALVLPAVAALPRAGRVRRLVLVERMDSDGSTPISGHLGLLRGDPSSSAGATAARLDWMDPVTENPRPGDTEIWEIYNTTADAHPVHIHEVAFEVVNRQQLADPPPGVMNPPVRLAPGSKPMPPRPGERGRKDSVLAYPGQVLRVRARFVQPGQFVWHCHVLEHEDNEMMRPLRVGPVQPGQPG